jgi:hypothetical protein
LAEDTPLLLIVETPLFTKQILALATDEEYRALQQVLGRKSCHRRPDSWRRRNPQGTDGEAGNG